MHVLVSASLMIEMPFTEVEISFLSQHGYAPEDVYDGRFESKPGWQEGAKAAGKILVLAGPCTKPGRHRLKTRSGHCVQCDPRKIAYQRRESIPGYVYIAGSLKGRLVKIGMAEDSIPQRESKLRAERYGGFGDWVIIYTARVDEAGRIERAARKKLNQYGVTLAYVRDGLPQDASELLQCSFGKARQALDAVIDNPRCRVWRSPQSDNYVFD